MEQFILHLVYDVLSKKTIDKVLRLLRKLDWNDAEVSRIFVPVTEIIAANIDHDFQTQKVLHRVFTKPWKLKYGNIGLLAMLTYDLQRYHPDFVISVLDQVLEDVRRGCEVWCPSNWYFRVDSH